MVKKTGRKKTTSEPTPKRRRAIPARAEASPNGDDDTPVDRKAARRERRRAQLREEILEATRVVLKRDGVAFKLEAVAQELELTKAALYHYFPSKDALIFAAVHAELLDEARAIAEAVERAETGAEALRALIATSVEHYANRLDEFRLAYLYAQVNHQQLDKPTQEMLEEIRPMNAMIYGTVQKKLEADGPSASADMPDPRRLAFLAHVAAVGLMTWKGMVEAADDPLIHSDADLVNDLAVAFEAAEAMRRKK